MPQAARTPSTIGILGGGQLARMLILAAYPLGLSFRVLDPDPSCPAAPLTDLIVGGYADDEALAEFVQGVDVVTYEFENVPADTARWLADHAPVFPPALARARS
jgi:5-(carboxyamino)imidazole ribonucleotide synthase